jgi:hypothetical protein
MLANMYYPLFLRFGQKMATFNSQNRYEKRQVLCNVLEMKINVFVFHYSPQ